MHSSTETQKPGGARAWGRRLVPFLFIVTTVLTARAGVRVRDATLSTLASVGEEVGEIRPGERTLLVNGVRMRIEVLRPSGSLEEALDDEREHCLDEALGARPWWAQLGVSPALRMGDEDAGVVGCVVPDAPWRHLADLVEALERFTRSGDLGDIGRVALSWGRRSGSGVSLLRLVTEGPLPIASAFPEDRDVPGTDPPWLPRPPDARRTLSAEELGAAPGVVAYESTRSVAGLRAWYAERAAALGWHATETVARGAVTSLYLARGDEAVVVALEGSGATTSVALVRLR